MNYFRITAYHEQKDLTVIFDSFNRHDALWKFIIELRDKGFNVIEASENDFIEGNMPKTDKYEGKIILRAAENGKPKYKEVLYNGNIHKAVSVSYKYYPVN